MKLIIDIPEEDYNFVKRQVVDGITNPLKICIANGTPLPENHGRIVDLDTVTVEEDTNKGVLWLDAPTILEASYGK